MQFPSSPLLSLRVASRAWFCDFPLRSPLPLPRAFSPCRLVPPFVSTNWEEIRREILIQSLVHHSNVVRILTSFVVEQDLWLVMPLLEAGSCAHIMKTLYPMGIKDEAMVATILKEVLNGLLYFHKDGRLHRDLKAGNILISASGDVQLADFGVAGTLMENGDRKKARRTFTGTVRQGLECVAAAWSLGRCCIVPCFPPAPAPWLINRSARHISACVPAALLDGAGGDGAQ